MVKLKMWEIHRTLPEFPKKHFFTRKFKSVKMAKKEVRAWNVWKNPHERVGIVKILKPKRKRKRSKK